jgi:hypothetical protein
VQLLVEVDGVLPGHHLLRTALLLGHLQHKQATAAQTDAGQAAHPEGEGGVLAHTTAAVP